mmetsp:Transcript_27347/g.57744  ORF Transcript_27347/g.57744 Transcript_27347/m.57744 type:complete len:671 (+) Transcript_27347:88-2100(+)
MHWPASWRAVLMLAMSAVECKALSFPLHCQTKRFHRCRHDLPIRPQPASRGSLWHNQQRPPRPRESNSHFLSSHNREDIDLQDDGDFTSKTSSSPGFVTKQHQSDHFAVAAASFVALGSLTLTFGHADTVHALDNAPFGFSILQSGKYANTSPPQNSFGVAFQSFLQKDNAQTKSNTRILEQLPTLLSSEQSNAVDKEMPSVIKTIKNEVKEDPKATQQPIVKPVASGQITSSSKQIEPKSTTVTEQSPNVSPQKSTKGELTPIDVKKITEENKIDVELICKDDQRPLDSNAPKVIIDRETFTKVKVYQPPFLQYLPSSVQPLISRQFQSLRVLKSIPDNQLFLASVFAGSITEIIRTSLLYPLSTVKARVQARTSRRSNRKRSAARKLRVSWLTAVHEIKRGDWYAGILPSLLITVPASGVYSGMKEVSRRAISMAIHFQVFQNLFPGDDAAASSYYSALVVNLLAAFVADIASVAIRTPADVLALRLQVFGNANVRSDFGNWAKDSVALLPSMILTDVPFLLSRIFLNAAITTSGENLGQYEFETIGIACLCAFLTTPFDVARTRILLPTLPSEEEDTKSDLIHQTKGNERKRRLVASSKYREQRREKLSVLLTMKRVAKEGNGGVQNLFAGWFERTMFLGVGRAWLDPLRVIGYLGIRDALLLKLFD